MYCLISENMAWTTWRETLGSVNAPRGQTGAIKHCSTCDHFSVTPPSKSLYFQSFSYHNLSPPASPLPPPISGLLNLIDRTRYLWWVSGQCGFGSGTEMSMRGGPHESNIHICAFTPLYLHQSVMNDSFSLGRYECMQIMLHTLESFLDKCDWLTHCNRCSVPIICWQTHCCMAISRLEVVISSRSRATLWWGETANRK